MMHKTLFITMTSNMVFRNLFFFPGSVFDRLCQELKRSPDLRIVVILNKKDLEKYSVFFKDVLGERCVMIPAAVPYPKNFLEKAFNFFYSYFIYTGTTKTLATVGMRLDEPPAGGRFKKYLAPLKMGIAKTFGRSRFMREKAVPALYHRIFKGRQFASLFDQYQPSVVFASHVFGRIDTELLAEAKRRGVKTMGMVSCWDHFDKYYLPFKVDTLLAQSDQVKDFAVKYQGYSSRNIVLTGHPYFDFMVDKKYAAARSDTLAMLGIPEHSKYILYVSGSAYCQDEPEIIEEILNWMNENRFGTDVRLVIRPYQGGRGKDKEFDKQKYDRFESHPRVVFFRRELWSDLQRSVDFANILRHSHGVLAVYSTMTLEAAVMDAPLVGVAFDGRHIRPFNRSIKRFALREHFKDVFQSGAVAMAHDFDELFHIIQEYLGNPKKDQEARERLRKRMCYTLDGNISERMAKTILNSLDLLRKDFRNEIS
ncbi:MAG: hypothetical protein HYT37_00860 [Candidatus Sungbacteria bacterium]|nr:hypothetical protein [Candidatus Sungbacteria bacterium]